MHSTALTTLVQSKVNCNNTRLPLKSSVLPLHNASNHPVNETLILLGLSGVKLNWLLDAVLMSSRLRSSKASKVPS